MIHAYVCIGQIIFRYFILQKKNLNYGNTTLVIRLQLFDWILHNEDKDVLWKYIFRKIAGRAWQWNLLKCTVLHRLCFHRRQWEDNATISTKETDDSLLARAESRGMRNVKWCEKKNEHSVSLHYIQSCHAYFCTERSTRKFDERLNGRIKNFRKSLLKGYSIIVYL